MSELKVNKISPRSGTDVTLGDSGDTITIPSGATFSATPYGLFTKVDPTVVAWNKTGAFTLTTNTGLYIEVNGNIKTIASGTSITMPGSATAGTDYAIWCTTAGALEATTVGSTFVNNP